jgi:hypothetical protein
MRDPVAPIPSPAAPQDRAHRFWRQAGPPPRAPRSEASYDPLRLLPVSEEDPGMIDRRRRRRSVESGSTLEQALSGLAAPGHEPVSAVVGLCTRNGWALVHTLSLAPGGVLLELLDLLNPRLGARPRQRGRDALAHLAPHLGPPTRSSRPASLLAMVGGCLLSRRMVEDLSAWVHARRRPAASSRGPATHATSVTLAVPLASSPGGPRSHPTSVVRIPGVLVPLTDPQPHVLAVSLSDTGRGELRRALARDLARARVPRRSPRAVGADLPADLALPQGMAQDRVLGPG